MGTPVWGWGDIGRVGTQIWGVLGGHNPKFPPFFGVLGVPGALKPLKGRDLGVPFWGCLGRVLGVSLGDPGGL